MKAKISQIGNSVGVILPKEAVARLKIKKGDSVFLTETSEGYVVTPYDPEFEKQMAVAREGAYSDDIRPRIMMTPGQPF